MTRCAKHKPFVIPIFIPHAGCPHRCIFCDQTRTTGSPESLPTTEQVDQAINRFLGFRKDDDRHTEISFYGGNFLGLPEDRIMLFLENAAKHIADGSAHGIRFSTRPDTIDNHRMDVLTQFPVTTIELGVQSMNNSVLDTSRRGHSSRDTHEAVSLIKKTTYRLGLQMMVGLPGDTPETAMATGEALTGLKPDFVRIYPTLVLEGSPLAHWYRQGRYTPLNLKEAVHQVKALYRLFLENDIPVIRMGLQATDGLDRGTDLLAGPFHPAFGEFVRSALWLDAMREGIERRSQHDAFLDIRLNPSLVSQVKGHHSKNIDVLCREFSLKQIHLIPDDTLPLDHVLLDGKICRFQNKPKDPSGMNDIPL